MPTPMVHITFVEELGESEEVALSLRTCIRDHSTYARLGAVLPDLQYYQHFSSLLLRYILGLALPFSPWSYLFHSRAPATLGRALIEVHRKEPVKEQTGPKLALIAGYFSHLALDRTLHPVIQTLAAAEGRDDAHAKAIHSAGERYQSLFFHQEIYGVDIAGTSICRRQIRLLAPGRRSLSPSLYFFLQKACLETFARSPRKGQFDNWIHGLHRYARVVSSPVGRCEGLRGDIPRLRRQYFENENFRFSDHYRRAKGLAAFYLNLVHRYWQEEDLSEEARRRFQERITNADLGYPLTKDLWEKAFSPSER